MPQVSVRVGRKESKTNRRRIVDRLQGRLLEKRRRKIGDDFTATSLRFWFFSSNERPRVASSSVGGNWYIHLYVQTATAVYRNAAENVRNAL
jgi:hypothetical protein